MVDKPARILVVEDSPTQAQTLRGILEAVGFEVTLAPDGERGFDLVRNSAFDLVITDILMPGISGYELCRRIKTDAVMRKVPVILLSQLRAPDDVIQGLECGADNFITKPFQADHLIARIRSMLGGHAPATDKERIEVVLFGRKIPLHTDREQILGLLAATFEDVVRTNRELTAARVQVEQYARQLEGRVRSSEDQYRHLMAQANDAILVLDPLGRVQEVNRSAEELLGQPAAEVRGRHYEGWVPAADLDHYQGQFQRLLAEGFVRTDNTHLIRADGRELCVDYSASLVAVGGNRVILAILRDVTERNHLERQLHQAQKMEAVGRLAGGVAHDFNNLLTIIGGYSEMLLSQRLPDDEARGLIEEIKKAGDRAAGLTRQLLAFSRQQVLAPRVLDLNAVVGDTEKMLRRLIGEDVQLTAVLDPALGRVKVDPGQVEQVLMNLAINAHDAMPQGGKLTIETHNAELDETYARLRPEVKPGRYVMLAVSDTGCGMDETTRVRIFEPFFTTKEVGKGTGLGLATVYGIVKQSGGYIYVYSEPGIGTTFKIYLPLVTEDLSLGMPSPSPLGPAVGTETLLLVEDDDGVRLLTRHVLQETYGYTVLEASQGAQAVGICERHKGPIHLLVSDVVMPEMGGSQLAERLVALRPGLKVLYLSGYTEDAVVRHGVLQAEVAFLQKPFTPIALANKVRAVLDKTDECFSRSGGKAVNSPAETSRSES